MIIKRLLRAFLSGKAKGHFGQYGEDIIIHKLFTRKKTNGIYIDIGAYHPFYFSNTAYLWAKGWHGINVDANHNSIEHFKRARPSDKNILGSVVPSEIAKIKSTIPIYVPEKSRINAMGTCDEKLAKERNFQKKINVPTLAIKDIFDQVKEQEIDFLNIDIEGLDEVVLNDIDFYKYNPKVICVEDYSDNISDVLNSGISAKLFSVGYILKARVGSSSVFLKI